MLLADTKLDFQAKGSSETAIMAKGTVIWLVAAIKEVGPVIVVMGIFQ